MIQDVTFVKPFNGKFQSGSITIVTTIVKRTIGGNIKESINPLMSFKLLAGPSEGFKRSVEKI